MSTATSSSSLPAIRQGARLVDSGRASLAAARDLLPRGNTLPADEWAARHRAMLWLLWLHVAGLPVFLLCQGFGAWGSIAPVLPLAVAGAVGMLDDISLRARSVAVAFGLLTASAVLVYGWHGQIEAHFHYFVMIAVLALYEDWLPFGLAVLYVALEHGVLGALAPHDVYSHGGSPWAWAAVHGGFVLAAAAAGVATWRLNENTRTRLVLASTSARDLARQFKVAFESGISGMSIVDADGRFLRVNRALCEMLGYSEAELLARRFRDLTDPEDLPGNLEAMARLMQGVTDVYEAEKRYRHRAGGTVWARIGVKTIRDERGGVDYMLCQINDVTIQRRAEQELLHRALHDPLTGLPNRRLFLTRVEEAVARLAVGRAPLAVMFVDLDRFKLVNDTMGHTAGDGVLREAAQRLAAAVRTEDMVARLGGDEFTIVCEDADEQEARRVADRVARVLAEPFEHQRREFRLSASVGIRISASPDRSGELLLRDADIALYAAKQHGQARVEVFDAEVHGRRVDPLAAEQALRRAIAGGELRLHYQPEVVLSSRRVVALEALVRWQHPELGLLGPGEFIPMAEQSELIVELGTWVLHEACRQLGAWRRAGTVEDDVRVAVNVSAQQLADPRFADVVLAALNAASLEADSLCLEITENAVIHEVATGLANLEAINLLGVSVALDDFGIGFSSLGRIRDLPPVDVIKIDRSFVTGLDSSAADAAVISAVVSIGASLGATVIAEGIETEAQLDALRELRCEVGQGFLFARPQPPDDLLPPAGEPLLARGAVDA
ncbi:MAG: putative bifunctional diguanylate cyclase/phosphodiesterase [Solirubrobacteraceae bacterium]